MKRGRGYTILEVMIFVAISGFMLIAAMIAIGGRQQEVQFQQATRDFENKINDFISDVEIGYFERDAGFSCEATGIVNPEPDIDYTSGLDGSVQGQSGDCVLIGKAIVMGEEPNVTTSDVNDEDKKATLRIFDMAGVRLIDQNTNEPAQNILDAKPKPLATASSPVNTYALRYGLEVEKVIQYDASLPPQEEAASVLMIMNNAQAGLTSTFESDDASVSAGSTSAKVLVGTFNDGISASTGLNDFTNNWRRMSDGGSPEFTTIAICLSGPNARGSSSTVSNWNHRETAALLVGANGNSRLVFDDVEDYCDAS